DDLGRKRLGMRSDLVDLVASVPAMDALGERHRTATLAWLRATDDVLRRERPESVSRTNRGRQQDRTA
ncbi:hypothetical protein, partial [uncultured Amnibacterium sp.]|uniref:hypothetical protein n=1 Tax=uncultured Amnibacterium sp. TaxID=1631851 RepID=UPI0035CC4854